MTQQNEERELEDLAHALSASNLQLPNPAPSVLLQALKRIENIESIERLTSLNGSAVGITANGWHDRPLAGLALLLQRQARLVRQSIWAASLIVLAVGAILTWVFPSSSAGGSLLALAAPIVAAGGVALLYGPENDPAAELELATPVSPALILLARLVLVYAYNLALGLLATLALWLPDTRLELSPLILSWLGPMLFLSALALALSVFLNSQLAILFSFSLWGLHLVSEWHVSGLPPSVTGLTGSLWSNQPFLYALAVLCLGMALWKVTRQEQRYG